ncbi:diguanylate cyclase domain-containing protein [Nocardioides sp. SYSU DS0651]|uniref:diguanylate cyclase domain-containing protein n=1 Tax=Nocardioides sp. SYSU DS0651 TaxID=3415955 RepID=UPI003F4B674B
MAPVAGGTAVLIAGVVLVAWARGPEPAHDWVPSLTAMKVNSALCVLGAGLSLLANRSSRRGLALAALVPLVLGGLTLVEWLGDVSLGIDELVMDDPRQATAPGRPSPQLAAAVVIFAVARLASASHRERVGRFGGAVTALFAIAVVGLETGYLYGAPEVTSASSGATMTLPSAAAALVLLVGLLALNAHRRPLTYLWHRGLTGTLTRSVLPAVILVPPALGMVQIAGEERGWYGLHFGVAVFTASMMVALAVVVTVTARSVQAAEAEVDAATAQLQSYLDAAPDAMVMVDRLGVIRYANPQVLDLVGYRPEEVVGRPLDDVLTAESQREHARLRTSFTERGTHGRSRSGVDLAVQHRDGRTIAVEVTLGPVKTSQGRWVAAAIRDVTERRDAERALRDAEQRARFLADHDPLTGLWNRRRFERELATAVESSLGSGALLIIDIDHFKAVNDTLGHHAGDELLKAVARRLTECAGPHGSVSRIGGDEFAVLLPRSDRLEVDRIARQVVGAVRACAGVPPLDAVVDPVGASVGAACFDDLAATERTRRGVLIRADEALYEAKRAGRGRHSVAALRPAAG